MDVNGQSKNYFKLLEPKLSTVSSSSNLANYDNYCTSACSVYLQKSSDHGRTPASIAGGFDCSSDFEAIGSATNSYATSNFQWSSADHTLKFIPDSTALTTYICYVCVATPTDATAAATSSNIQTKKTEAIKIEVGDCAANPPTVTNSGWRLIKQWQNTQSGSFFYMTADRFSGNLACIKEYVLQDYSGNDFSSITSYSRNIPVDCENLAIGLTCLIFRISLETTVDDQKFKMKVKLWDDSIPSENTQEKINIWENTSSCGSATISCVGGNSYNQIFAVTTSNMATDPTYAISASDFQSSDSGCTIEGYRIYMDSGKKRLIQESQFYQDNYGAKMNTAISTSFYYDAGDSLKFNSAKIGTRDYYITAYNYAGVAGHCILKYTVCGQETISTQTDYLTTPYQYEYTQDSTAGAQETIEFKFRLSPLKEIFDTEGISYNIQQCYQRFTDASRFEVKVYNSATQAYDINAADSSHISFDIDKANSPWNPRLYVSKTTDQLLKTRIMVTTRGGLQAMAYFDFKIAGVVTIYLTSATDDVLTVSNEAAVLGKVNTFTKNDVNGKFSSTSSFSTFNSVVLGQITSPDSSTDRALSTSTLDITTGSSEDTFIKIGDSGNLEISLSSLPTFQISKTYAVSAQTTNTENAFNAPATSHANGYDMEICIPPYLKTSMKPMKVKISYDSNTAVNYIFTVDGATISQGTNKGLLDVDVNFIFPQEFPNILFGAYSSSFITSQVEIVAEMYPINSNFKVKVDDQSKIYLQEVLTLINILTSQTQVLASTEYTVNIITKLKSETYQNVDYSQTKWQNCKFYQQMKLTLESEVLDLFYNAKEDLVTTFNTASDMTATQTIAKATILAKFSANCGQACSDPLTILKIGEIDASNVLSALSHPSADELAFLYVDGTSGDLKIDFSKLPAFQQSRAYAVYAETATGRSTLTNKLNNDDFAYVLPICVPPYIKQTLDDIKFTLSYLLSLNIVTIDYVKGSSSVASQANITYSTLDSGSFTYDLPELLWGYFDQNFIKTNVQMEVSDGQSEIKDKMTIASDLKSISFTNMHSIVKTLSSESYNLNKDYSLTIKTSPKPQQVGDLNFADSRWASCVHYTTLKFSINSVDALVNKIYIASSSDSKVIATYNTLSSSTITNSLTISQTSILSRFTTTDSSKPNNAIMLAQIDSNGGLVAAGITASSVENSILSVATDLLVDFSQVHSFTIAKRYAITTSTTTGEDGINDSDTTQSNGYKMDLCIPPYFKTAFGDLDLSLSYIDSQGSFTFSDGVYSTTVSNQASTALNTQVLEYTLPTILFETKDYSSWVKSNVVVSIASIDSSISSYFSVSGMVLQIKSINDLVNSVTSNSQVTGGKKSFSIILKTQLPSSTVDGIDYSNSEWQACVYYQKLSFSITSTKSVSTVASTWFDSSQLFSPGKVEQSAENVIDTKIVKFIKSLGGKIDPQQSYDTDKNEVLSFEEAKFFINEFFEESDEERITSMFNKFDMNKDGSIDQYELRRFVEAFMNKDYSVVIPPNQQEPEEADQSTVDESIQQTNEDQQVQGVVVDTSIFDDIDEPDFKTPPKPPTIKTKPLDFKLKMSSTGSLALKFNQELTPSSKLKRRKLGIAEDLSNIIDIKYKKHESVEDNSEQLYTVTFNEVSEDGKSMIFQIGFDDPLGISQGEMRDKMSIAINKEHFNKLFVNKDGEMIKFKKEQADKLKYDVSLPLQAPPQDSVQFKSFEQQKDVVESQKNAGIVTILINYALKAAFGQIWSAAYSLQMITYLSLINIMYAQCTVDLFAIMIDLAAFDVVPEEFYQPFQEYLLPFPSDYGYSHGFIEIGYETGHMLASMFFVWFMVALQIIYYIVFSLIYKCTKRMCPKSKLNNYAKSCLVDRYSFFQRTLFGCALEIFVSGLIELIFRQATNPFEKVSYYFSVAILIIMVWFCFKIVHLYRHFAYKMSDTKRFPVFNNKWGVVWEELNGKQGDRQPYQLFFLLRRMIFALIIVAIPTYTNWNTFIQYALIVNLNLMSVVYLCASLPFDSIGRNRTEIFNEYINLLISINFLISMKKTEIDYPKVLYNIGLLSNYLLITMIAINLLFVIQGMIKDCRLSWLRKKNYKREQARIKSLMTKLKKSEDGKQIKLLEKQLKQIQEAEKKPDEEEEIDACLIENEFDDADKNKAKRISYYSKRKGNRIPNTKNILKPNKNTLQIIKEQDEEYHDSSREQIETQNDLDKTNRYQIDAPDSAVVPVQKEQKTTIGFYANLKKPKYVRGDPLTRSRKPRAPSIPAPTTNEENQFVPSKPVNQKKQEETKEDDKDNQKEQKSIFRQPSKQPYVRRKKQ